MTSWPNIPKGLRRGMKSPPKVRRYTVPCRIHGPQAPTLNGRTVCQPCWTERFTGRGK